MNAYLKEIADKCSIKKVLTFHLSRHSFATTVTLANGVSLETVSKMLGHKLMRTTQHYAKIVDKRVSLEMEVVKAILTVAMNVLIKSSIALGIFTFFLLHM